jgi:conjugative transposon TraN protein
MKTIIVIIITFVYSSLSVVILHAQAINANTMGLVAEKIEPYYISVTYNKTSHLIFPSAIRYVDLGSQAIIAGKAEGASNVLRIKAAVKDFSEATNFTVITEDGQFYNFDVSYNANPDVLNYNMRATEQTVLKQQSTNDILFEELENYAPQKTDLMMKAISEKNKKTVRHVRSKSFGITFLLKSLYIHDGKYYFQTEVKNSSNVDFKVERINYKIVDKKRTKRTVIQEKILKPLRSDKPLDTISAQTTTQNIFMFDSFTLDEGKILLIQIFEENGGRHQTLKIKNKDLIKAGLIKSLHLTF